MAEYKISITSEVTHVFFWIDGVSYSSDRVETMTFNGGEVVRVSISAHLSIDYNYKEVEFKINGVDYDVKDQVEFTINSDVHIIARSVPTRTTLDIYQGFGSSLTVTRNGTTLSNGSIVNVGDVLKIEYSITNEKYLISSCTIGDVSVSSGDTYTVTNGEKPIAIRLFTAVKSYSLSISKDAGTSVTVKKITTGYTGPTTSFLSDGASISHGDTLVVYFDVTNADKYELKSSTVNGVSCTTGTEFTVTGAVEVKATSSVRSYTLTAPSSENYSVTFTSDGKEIAIGSSVPYGAIVTLAVTTKNGYNLSKCTLVNGSTTTTISSRPVSYKFSVKGQVSVEVSVLLNSYLLSISTSVGLDLTVTRDGVALSDGAVVSYDDVLALKCSAKTGYQISSFTVNNSSYPPDKNITFSVRDNVTIDAVASVLSYLFSVNADKGSIVSVSRTSSPLQGAPIRALKSGESIYYNDVLAVKFSVKSGYIPILKQIGSQTYSSSTTSATFSVRANVEVIAKSQVLAISIGGDELFVTSIKDENDFGLYVATVYTEDGWVLCGSKQS